MFENVKLIWKKIKFIFVFFCLICYLDIDECIEGFYGCYSNGICENIVGLYNCICKIGFFGDGFSCELIGKL